MKTVNQPMAERSPSLNKASIIIIFVLVLVLLLFRDITDTRWKVQRCYVHLEPYEVWYIEGSIFSQVWWLLSMSSQNSCSTVPYGDAPSDICSFSLGLISSDKIYYSSKHITYVNKKHTWLRYWCYTVLFRCSWFKGVWRSSIDLCTRVWAVSLYVISRLFWLRCGFGLSLRIRFNPLL